jgi:hypothetical protein
MSSGWTVRESIPTGSEVPRTRPERPGAHPALSTWVSSLFPGSKLAGAWR